MANIVTFSGGSIDLDTLPIEDIPNGMTEDRVRELLMGSAIGREVLFSGTSDGAKKGWLARLGGAVSSVAGAVGGAIKSAATFPIEQIRSMEPDKPGSWARRVERKWDANSKKSESEKPSYKTSDAAKASDMADKIGGKARTQQDHSKAMELHQKAKDMHLAAAKKATGKEKAYHLAKANQSVHAIADHHEWANPHGEPMEL